MADRKTDEQPPIRVGGGLGEAFDRLQETIRERAYHIFLHRDEDGGNPLADWFAAQSELLTPIELVIKEQKKNLVAECNLKGFSPEDIEIEVENGVLKVFGSHSQSSSEEKDGATTSRSESVYFFQSAQLPAEVNLDESHAKLFKNGKLQVTLPRV